MIPILGVRTSEIKINLEITGEEGLAVEPSWVLEEKLSRSGFKGYYGYKSSTLGCLRGQECPRHTTPRHTD